MGTTVYNFINGIILDLGQISLSEVDRLHAHFSQQMIFLMNQNKEDGLDPIIMEQHVAILFF